MSEDEQTEDNSPLGQLKTRVLGIHGMREGNKIWKLIEEAVEVVRHPVNPEDIRPMSAAVKMVLEGQLVPLQALSALVKEWDAGGVKYYESCGQIGLSFNFAEALERARVCASMYKHAELCHDILGLAGKYVPLMKALRWTRKQREEAIKWGAKVHGGAAVEEPPFPKMPKAPEHVAELPDMQIDPPGVPGRAWMMRLTYPDGRVEVVPRVPGG